MLNKTLSLLVPMPVPEIISLLLVSENCTISLCFYFPCAFLNFNMLEDLREDMEDVLFVSSHLVFQSSN